METPRSLQDLAPAALPPGTEIGSWRVLERRGRGNYGAVYRVEDRHHPDTGSFALKLATHPLDPRFEREGEMLSRIHHPGVPRLIGQGLWAHPAGPFPFLVMEWVEGQPLYDWGRERRPTSRQVLQALAQVARALEATHAQGAVHRDVKGDNVLVRASDGHAILTDFGAGYIRGAPTLTAPPLPPGTPPYRSPQAIRFQWDYRSHPTARYESQPADDVFALGVTAYQLVTGTYPPPPRVDTPAGGTGAVTPLLPPRLHNPAVCGELDALILRMLAEHPEQRLGGPGVAAVARALEEAAATAGPRADLPLSNHVAPGPHAATPRVDMERIVHAAAWDHAREAAHEARGSPVHASSMRGPLSDARQEPSHGAGHGPAQAPLSSTGPKPPRDAVRSAAPGPTQAPPHDEPPRSAGHAPTHDAGHEPPPPQTWSAPRSSSEGAGPRPASSAPTARESLWWAGLAVATVCVSFLSAMAGWFLRPDPTYEEFEVAWASPDREARDGGTVALGDAAVALPVTILAPVPTFPLPPGFGLPMPDRPFPGQRKPPCNRKGEVELRGGCWYELARVKSPCDDDAYDYKGACYLPSFPVQRPHTSAPAMPLER
jgi:hypothetical protein